ncbi:hypothetical protein ACSX1A_17890 [Pontibacter sp. MBLB2868]|uniref:hypothetical protein n=1 Tax=Pontibacter sp. MBLB2868 TaxID=3451555 RepID=UPI003F74E108
MNDSKLQIITGLLSAFLAISLLVKLHYIPGGMILSGLFLGSMLLVAIIFGCLVVAGILRVVTKKYSFITLFSVATIISFLVFHYKLYSPTLKIIVPNGFTGEVTLILANVDENILNVDSNGIGYINQWTFEKTYTEPVVYTSDGNNIKERLVGFNPSAFWGNGKVCCIQGKEIHTLNFEVVPLEKLGEKQYYSKDLTALIDTALVLAVEPDRYTRAQTEAFETDIK